MPLHLRRSTRGFTLVELMVAMAVTIIVLAAAVMVFQKSMEAVNQATVKAEMQANARSAVNSIVRDLSQAGSGGIPWGGITTVPAGYFYAHDINGVDYLTGNTSAINNLFAVFPAFAKGPVVDNVQTDGINVVYTDPDLTQDWAASLTDNTAATPPIVSTGGGGYTVTMPSAASPAVIAGKDQATNPPPNDPAQGLKLGDIVMLTNTNGSALGVVTVAPAGFTITLGSADPLLMNGGIANIANGDGTFPATTVTRIFLISYFIQPVNVNNVGLAPTAVPPAAVDYRLMRMVNALPPVPVAEHIVGLRFNYDLSDPTTGATTSNVTNAELPPGTPVYNQIRNVYINLTARSTPTPKGSYFYTTMFTNESPRNLSFHDKYN